jgi:hypothetical protein
MKKLLLLLFLLPLSSQAVDWNFSLGSAGQLKKSLEKNLGMTKIFNCDVSIEKVPSRNEDSYFISIYDNFVGNEAMLNINISKNIASNKYGMIQLSKHYTDNMIKTLQIYQNEKFEIKELIIREIDFHTMDFFNNIKCSANGRTW